ncbi:MAG: hypothetical protein H6814_05650 [Phycisphaeraceae bacterium]|nr:hypothetical protein [Phycisphaeraceae bacterium]
MKTKTGYEEQMCMMFHRYQERLGDEPVDLDDLYNWAESNEKWEPPRRSKRAMFKREMSRALSRERIITENGERVRRNHAFRVKKSDKQGYFRFWDDIIKMKPNHFKMSMQQRLLSIANRAILHDRDARYYNDHNEFGAQLEFDYNLNPHVENAKHPIEYPDERPEGE